MSTVPIIILKEGAEEVSEREALERNISAMVAIANTVKSTLGPKGMSKMIVDSMGDTTITNDGAEILDKLDIENVSANMMVNLAKSIDKEMGDGTTSAVVLCAQLLQNAKELVEQEIHPRFLTKGYKLAMQKALEIIDNIAEKISKDDEKILRNIAITAMNAKDVAEVKDYLADLAVNAVKKIAGKKTFDKIDNVKIIKSPGKSLIDSEIINGIYIKKEKANNMMPDQIKNAKIAVIRRKLAVSKTEYDAQIQIFNPEDIRKYLKQEEKILKKYLDIFKKLEVNVIVNNQDISDKFAAMLGREGIIAVKNVGESDYKAVLKATGATFTDDLTSLSEKDLGYAELAKFEKIDKDWYLILNGCKNPKAISILLKGGLEKILDSAEITLKDVLSVVAKVIDTEKVVAGGGAAYIELAKQLKEYANEVSGKEQLAITAFALALEEIPKTLIKNAGLDEVDFMTELRAAHRTETDKWIGIDTLKGEIGNNFERGIIEPAELVKSIIKSATELANLILRVDKIVIARNAGKHGFQP
ncbi:MAG: thermosome subunit beta [Promethearchaeota archaeon]